MGNLCMQINSSNVENGNNENGKQKKYRTDIVLPEFSTKRLQALYNYEAAQEGDLSFKKGDILYIIDDSDPDWWQCSHSRTKQKGMTPSNYVALTETLDSKEWFFGKPTKNDVERFLKIDTNVLGTFLIRESETIPGQYSLSLLDMDMQKNEKIIKHYRIKLLDDNRGFYIAAKKDFASLDLLVKHYMVKSDGLSRRLVAACPKEAPIDTDLSSTTRDNWEIDRNTVKLDIKLGSGMFGDVWKGKVKGKWVAVKTLKEGTMPVQKFMDEANAMKLLKHKNIVSLFAVCSKEEPIYIITELMDHGSLQSFLKLPKSKQLKLKNMIDFSAQIACGMNYIEREKFCHRDLASRNVLVGGKSLICKIADFGLSRAIDEDIYEAQAGAKFPIKWTAPEAAQYGTFTIKSDVWSYGITLIEVFTFGAHPYPELPNRSVLSAIENGYRMPRPNSCPVDFYDNILLKCWNFDPERRPTFEYLEDYMVNYNVSSETQYQE